MLRALGFEQDLVGAREQPVGCEPELVELPLAVEDVLLGATPAGGPLRDQRYLPGEVALQVGDEAPRRIDVPADLRPPPCEAVEHREVGGDSRLRPMVWAEAVAIPGDQIAADGRLLVDHLQDDVARVRAQRDRFLDVLVLGRAVEPARAEDRDTAEGDEQHQERAEREARPTLGDERRVAPGPLPVDRARGRD